MNSCYKVIEKMLRISLFYMLLQMATSAMEYGYEKELDDALELNNYQKLTKQQRFEQILGNLHKVIKEKNNDHLDTRSSDDHNDLNENKDYDKQHFEEVLEEVTSALDKIKVELMKFKNDGVLTIEVPVETKAYRYKRDVSNETFTNVTATEDLVTDNIQTTTDKVETSTNKVEPVTLKPETVVDKKELLRADNDSDVNVNGRRMMPDYVTTTSRVKDKLLSYLEDTFNEVERKIKPLTNIKIALSNDDRYRIGYIIATIDTLEVNLKKLRTDMNLHQHFWNDEKILELFDRIKASNTVATTLIESLKKYLPKH